MEEKTKIHVSDFVHLRANFYQKVRDKYIELEGITTSEFTWRARMGSVNSQIVFALMPECYRETDIPNPDNYDIEYTDFGKKGKRK